MPSFLPSGDMHVPQPTGDAAWSECLRDLKRTCEGGSLSILGRGRRVTVRDPCKELGDVSHKACEQAFDELARIIDFEQQAQAMGLPPEVTAAEACWHPGCVRPARHDGPCVDAFLRRLEMPEGCEKRLTPELLKGLTSRVAASISVVPGMQAVMSHELPPALWQPSFVVCIGSGQVRVLTLAFVGEPVCGDRPSSKSTPFVLRLLTDDLASAESQGPSLYCVRHALGYAGTVALHLSDLDTELFTAAETGDWTSITKVAQTRRVADASGRTPSVGPQQSESRSPTSRGQLDRASRMRASLERAQMRPEQRLGAPPSPTSFPTTLPADALHSATSAPQPAVSVLADGLSVKAVTSALNNMEAGQRLRHDWEDEFLAQAKQADELIRQAKLDATVLDHESATEKPQPAVSVLADGLSVKAVTSALNNMASGATLGMFMARARAQSPGLGLLAEPPQTSEDATGCRDGCNIQKPTGHLRGVLGLPKGGPPPLRGVLASPQGTPPLYGTGSRRPASVPRIVSAPPLPVPLNSSVKPPVMDRAARMRDRIQRNQARASSKDSLRSDSR
eukprot:CAMPEP_0172933600 /NCGR_PEP_ID=MMETSP1075-20121228/220589_1 /TAXON_ID=2916 /ORGANISM="Ceratium fusus, Strain PA161109" /LENGTH=563 /DNA_ID=CAMNT_0013794943 /DNA_START=57 /DNA_END=1752 /DNA_ORIENTATION=-